MEEEELGLQEFRDSHSAYTSEDPLGPSSVLVDTEVQRIMEQLTSKLLTSKLLTSELTLNKGLGHTAGQHVGARLLNWRKSSEPTEK